MAYFEAFSSVYDIFTEGVNYHQRAKYILSLLEKNGIKGGALLDLACGTATLTSEFCKTGFEVIGVDLSEDMLMIAREKLSFYGNKVLLLCQDMRELDLFGTVNACVCSLDSINHLESIEDVRRVFENVFLFMQPGGVFIFDVNTIYKHQSVLADNTFVYESEDAFLVWQNSLQDNGRSVDIMLDIFVQKTDGSYERSSEDFTETAFSIEELKQALKIAGFTDICVYDDMTLNIAKENSQRLYFVARKN